MTGQIAIYLLHCETPDGGAEHYFGSTTTEHFNRRMREHLSRNGSRETKKLFDSTERWWLALCIRMSSRHLERALQRLDDPASVCPVCTPSLDPRLQTDIRILRHRRPNFDAEYPLTWSSACGPLIK